MHEKHLCRDSIGTYLFSMGMTLASSIGMPVIRIVQLADGEELVTLGLDQCVGHLVDDPRDELLKYRHTAEASPGLSGTPPGCYRGIGGAQLSQHSHRALVAPFSLPRLGIASLGIHPEAVGARNVEPRSANLTGLSNRQEGTLG